MRLAAGLCPYPLGELERSPHLIATIGGGVLLLRGRERRGGEGEGREGKGEGRKGKGEGRKGRQGKGR